MEKMLLGKADDKVYLLANKGNQHGMIAGATGTGKTVTLKVMCEYFSSIGVPTILTDVKGDLVNMSLLGEINDKIKERIDYIGIEGFEAQNYPLHLWDVYGEEGVPLRITISQMGPLMLARVLELNDTQEGILNIAFKVADENGLLLLDLKDLRALLNYLSENRQELSKKYGNIAPQSLTTIQRKILMVEEMGGENFFQEPSVKIEDFLQVDSTGMGIVNVIMAKKLINSPGLYSMFLLWLLSELFENLPEVGNPEKPKCVFFFDEAHLLFSNAPKHMVEKITQIVRLIRSKGVGIFFITQNPIDIPSEILNQLGNRILHQMRAFSPREMQAVKEMAMTFRPNPKFEVKDEVMNLKTGEALVSTLLDDGSPSPVEKTLIVPPHSSFKTLSEEDLKYIKENSPYYKIYKDLIDRQSAYEILEKKAIQSEKEEQIKKEKESLEKEKTAQKKESSKQHRQKKSYVDKSIDSILGTVTRTIGREIARSIMGSLKKR